MECGERPMPTAGDAETTNSRAGASSPSPVAAAPGSRKGVAAVVSSAARVDPGVMSPLVAFIAVVTTPFLAFLSVWLFALFPWLWPWSPAEERRVSISEATVAERRFVLPEDREEVTVVTFNAEAVGYAANNITVATLWIDPVT